MKTIFTHASAKSFEEAIMFVINARNIYSFAFTTNASPFHTNPSTKSPIKEKNWRINISAFLRACVLTLERALIYLQCWGG